MQRKRTGITSHYVEKLRLFLTLHFTFGQLKHLHARTKTLVTSSCFFAAGKRCKTSRAGAEAGR